VALKIEVADLGLPALDALDVDAVAVFVGPERPLQGFAGFADWRMCGANSPAIRFGLPPGVPLAPDAFLRASRLACEAMAKAGSEAFATSLPPYAGDLSTACRLWLEGSLVRPVRRQVLLGEARLLQRELGTAKTALGVDVEIVAPPSRVEMPPRGRTLPRVGGAVR
jgi:hypothetical protein